MAKKKRNNIIARHISLFGKRLRALTPKKLSRWVNATIKNHPFILGFLALSWLIYIVECFFQYRDAKWQLLLKSRLIFHLKLVFVWFILVVISSLLKDRDKVIWFFRKRFVFFVSALLPPLGVILMWAGSRFKVITKIILTVTFIAYFIFSFTYQRLKYEKLIRATPVERVTQLISSKKGKVFLKPYEGLFPVIRDSTKKAYRQPKLTVSDIFSLNSKSIAVVTTFSKEGKAEALGSGFVISKDGFIVTNSHVVASAHKAEVKIGERVFKDVYLAKLIPDKDIAILKVEAKDLVSVRLGDSGGAKTGEVVVVLGNPLGFESSVSTGIISAIRTANNMQVIQITAPVSMGNSGGPVLNEYGEVIGIATIATFLMAQNVNFVVP